MELQWYATTEGGLPQADVGQVLLVRHLHVSRLEWIYQNSHVPLSGTHAFSHLLVGTETRKFSTDAALRIVLETRPCSPRPGIPLARSPCRNDQER